MIKAVVGRELTIFGLAIQPYSSGSCAQDYICTIGVSEGDIQTPPLQLPPKRRAWGIVAEKDKIRESGRGLPDPLRAPGSP